MILLAENSWEIRTAPGKGRGLFTTKPIGPGVVIGDYLGRVIRTATEDTSDKDGLYLMYYHDQASIYPTDVNSAGIHVVNHACLPNCWVYTYQGHTLFFTLRHIFAGEELSISYLLSPDEFCNPCTHQCLCESKLCTGSMHLSKDRSEKWRQFTEKQGKESKRARIRYGQELPKLTFYPKAIPDNPIYHLSGALGQPPLSLNNKKLPTQETLRQLMRESGRTLEFPNLKTRVLGMVDNQLNSEII